MKMDNDNGKTTYKYVTHKLAAKCHLDEHLESKISLKIKKKHSKVVDAHG